MSVANLVRPKKQHQLMKALLVFGPLAGIGAYFFLTKAKAAKAPQYDPHWLQPETQPHPTSVPTTSVPTNEAPAATLDDIVAMTNPPGGNDDLAVITKAGALLNKPVVDLNGDSVGEAEAIYYRSLSGEPEWIATTLGLVEPKRVLVPLDGASIEDEEIKVAQARADIEAAPAIEGPLLDDETEMALYGHYGVRRMLPGVESERNDENLRLRMWQPAASVSGDSGASGASMGLN
jgi:hypothetical protein